jgi:hypothetical protein
MYIVQKYRFNGSFNQYIGNEKFDTEEEAKSFAEKQIQYGVKCYIESLITAST